MPTVFRFVGVVVLISMWLMSACTTPPAPTSGTPSVLPASATPLASTSTMLAAPLTTQSNMRYAFGASDDTGRLYPGWLLTSEAATMRLVAMAEGDIVMVIPITFRKTNFLRIQLRTTAYDIEYVIASTKPIAIPDLQQRQHVQAGAVLFEAPLSPEEYVAVSILDRTALAHVCPRDVIDSAAIPALEQLTRRLVSDWCVAEQIPYNDNALLVPIARPESANRPRTTPTAVPITATLIPATDTPQAANPAPTVPTARATRAITPEPAVSTPTPVMVTVTQPIDDTLGALVYPVQNVAQIRIMEAFSTDASAPWGFAHNGIDFMTDQAREPVIASANGTITRVDVQRFPPRNNWQVNISLRVNDRYTIGYAIEPMTSDDAIGQAQIALITVQPGQSVTAGTVIGELIGGVDGAHIHWGISDATVDRAVCPAPFLSETQQRELLARIPSNPDRLCYP